MAILEWYKAAGIDLHLHSLHTRNPYTQLMAAMIMAIKLVHFLPTVISPEESDSEDVGSEGAEDVPIEYTTQVEMFEPEFDWRVWCKEILDKVTFRQPPGLYVSSSCPLMEIVCP